MARDQRGESNSLRSIVSTKAQVSCLMRLSFRSQTFDFEEKNCLYLTHSSYGARPERGVELLKINSQYKSAGLLLDAPELPDYLPVFLEYLSIAPESQSKNLVKEYIDSISKIKENLERSGSLYSIVLSACISAMNEMMGTRWNRFGFH